MANIDAGRTGPETRGQRAARSALSDDAVLGGSERTDRFGRSATDTAQPRRSETLHLSGNGSDDDAPPPRSDTRAN